MPGTTWPPSTSSARFCRTATVGQWGRDVRLGPQVVAVRQNLALLVDGGQVVPGIADNTGNRWGATLGNKLYVARSGLGVTATGQLVYVAGPSLSAATLADLLARAGTNRGADGDQAAGQHAAPGEPVRVHLHPRLPRGARSLRPRVAAGLPEHSAGRPGDLAIGALI